MACNDYVRGLVRASLGRVETIDLEYGEVEWGEYMQVKVNLDITKPLARRKKLNIGLPDHLESLHL